MTHIVVVAHAPLATALRAVAEHVYPDCAAGLIAVDIESALSFEQARDKVAAVVDAHSAGARATPGALLLLVDTLGATPGRAARAALAGAPCVVGVNVPMLWRTLCYRDESALELQQRAWQGGLRGVALWPEESTSG